MTTKWQKEMERRGIDYNRIVDFQEKILLVRIVSPSVGKIKIYADNKKVGEELMKALNWKPNIGEFQNGLFSFVLTEEKPVTFNEVEGVPVNFENDYRFIATSVSGEFFVNFSTMFRSCNQEIDYKLLEHSNFAIKFDYIDQVWKDDGCIDVFKNIYTVHKKGQSLLETENYSLNKLDEYEKKLTRYDYTLENLVITNCLDEWLDFLKAAEADEEVICSYLTMNIRDCFLKQANKDDFANELKKYKDIIEKLYGKTLLDAYEKADEQCKNGDLKDILLKISN